MPTDCSKPGLMPELIPRIVTVVEMPVSLMLKLGIISDSPCRSTIPASDIFSAVSAATDTGTSCRDWARCCAVTITSSSTAALSAPAALAIASASMDLESCFFMVFPLRLRSWTNFFLYSTNAASVLGSSPPIQQFYG